MRNSDERNRQQIKAISVSLTVMLYLFFCTGLRVSLLKTHTHTHTRQHIWFVSHHQCTLSWKHTWEFSKTNYSLHSIPPSVHLLLSSLFSHTHSEITQTDMHTKCSNVYHVFEAAVCSLINRSEQRSRAIESLTLLPIILSSPFSPHSLRLRGFYL